MLAQNNASLALFLSLFLAACSSGGTSVGSSDNASGETTSGQNTDTNGTENPGTNNSGNTNQEPDTSDPDQTPNTGDNQDSGSTTPDTDTTPDSENTGGTTDSGSTASGSDFGLSERAALSDVNLPIDGVRLGNYRLENVYPNLRFLEALLVDDVPGQNRMVVVEQAGRVKVFDDDPAVLEATEILNITDKVVFTGEQGLLGLAFDPDFVNNRFVYLYYTIESPQVSIISRMPWDDASDTLDESREEIILQVDQPYHSHNAGMIAFGSDNYLYIALGDGGDGGDPHGHGQNRATLLGSILRIDPSQGANGLAYSIPPSNPFVGEAGVREEIWAYGFRNPWRFSFDRQTGDMWLGDVGQEMLEEVNVVKAGGNYGWRVFEGTRVNETKGNTLPDSAFTPPVHEYTHDKGLSVIGGYVYRGEVASLRGRYLYSDFTSGVVTALTYDGTSVTAVDEIGSVEGPTSFGETRDGEVLVVSRYEGLFKFVEDSSTVEFPANLSQTGLFSDLASLTPSSGIIEYTPSHPFWSDGTQKRRWIGVPDGSTIEFTNDDWTFPIGSLSIKHFEMELTENSPATARRLETRVMYHTLQGWQGVTYRWNAAETDASLISERQSETLSVNLADGSTRQQQYDYPSSADCLACHTRASTFLLGLETAQLNTAFDYGVLTDNQLRAMNHVGLFSYDIGDASQYNQLPPLTDNTATVEQRARAYLDVNCSVCHQPGGTAPTSLDFRVSTGIDGLNAVNTVPQAGTFDLTDAKIIAPGSKERSVLWHRMNSLGSERMPPLSSHVVDEAAVKVIGDWIDAMQ